MPSPMCTSRRTSLIATLALLALAPVHIARAQATGTIEGVVTAVAGSRPISDVQITVVGTTLGARTDEQGRYHIGSVPAGARQLRSQRIGLASVTRSIDVVAGQTASVDFRLAEAALSLDAVVVTGTAAESRKKEVGNAMATIDMKPIEVQPVKNTQDILAGRGPGITVMQNSGQPGAGGTIRLRGTNSITQSNAPIVYVDGVRIYSDGGPLTPSARQSTLAMNDIKADDIERIEIVKGAAATTLYGTQASGGVIQIFTKKGSAGAPEWSLDAGTGVNFMGHVGPSSDPTGLFLNQCSGPNLHDAFGNPFVDPTCPASGSWLQHGTVQRYGLGVRGGSGALTYYLSGNYDDNPGVVQTSDAKNGGFRANFAFTPAKNLIFNVNSSYEKKLIHWLPDGNLANGFTLNVMRGPFNNFKGGKGECAGITITCTTNAYILAQDIENNGDHFISGFTLQYSPVTSFTNRFNVGFDYNDTDNKSVLPFGFLNLPTGSINSQGWNHTKLSLDYAGSFVHSVRTPRLMSTFSWGGQIFDDRERYTGITGTGFAGPADPTLASAASVSLGVDTRPRVVNAGYFLQEMLGWKDRLFVTGGLRVDGNSAFGKNFGLETYPKISASYVLSEEDFWPTRWIPTMKLRAALGESGKAPGAFDAVRTWDPVSGDAGKPGVTVSQLGDPDLGPERTREMEGGFDLSTPGDRVAVEMTYYRARTYGTLIGVTLPPSNGFNRTQLENAGTIQNDGLEVQISPVFLRTASVDWRGRFSASWMRSQAVDIGGQNISTGLGSYVRTGMPVPSIFGARIMNPDAVGVAPIVATDQYYGPVYPPRLFSAEMSLTLHRDITLNALADYQGGAYLTNFIGYQNALRNVWQPCYAAQQSLKAGDASSITARDQGRCAIDRTIANSDFWISKTNFVKLRSASIAYDLPQRFTRGMHGATVILAGQNLWKSTKFDGADPEANDAQDAGTGLGRREYYQIPPFKTVMLSIRTTF
ncbi:MAG TPA: TonB-dependent receptor [Gemmatimonadaceae bacterium]